MIQSLTAKDSTLTCALVIRQTSYQRQRGLCPVESSLPFILEISSCAAADKVGSLVKLRNLKRAFRQRFCDICSICFQSIWKYSGCLAPGLPTEKETMVSWWLNPGF